MPTGADDVHPDAVLVDVAGMTFGCGSIMKRPLRHEGPVGSGALSDVELHVMMEREIPCGLAALLRGGRPRIDCAGVATHWLRMQCRRCRRWRRVLVCESCLIFATNTLKMLSLLMLLRHDGCRRPLRLRMTNGRL